MSIIERLYATRGESPPPLRDGKVWAMHIWPGGRKELRQESPERCMSLEDATAKMLHAQKVCVAVEMAVALLQSVHKSLSGESNA